MPIVFLCSQQYLNSAIGITNGPVAQLDRAADLFVTQAFKAGASVIAASVIALLSVKHEQKKPAGCGFDFRRARYNLFLKRKG